MGASKAEKWGPFSRKRSSAIKPFANFLAGLELRHVFLTHINLFTRARVPADAGRAILDRESAEATKLDAVASRHGISDLVEDGIDDVLDIALEQMRIFRRELLDEFRLDHPWLQLRGLSCSLAQEREPTCQSETSPSSVMGPSGRPSAARACPFRKVPTRSKPWFGSGQTVRTSRSAGRSRSASSQVSASSSPPMSSIRP